MSVYFIQALSGGPIKIGYCNDGPKAVLGRLSGLQNGNPRRLVIRKVIPGDRDTEKSLHARFKDLRVSGEWFAPSPELAALACALSHDDLEDMDEALHKSYSKGFLEGQDWEWKFHYELDARVLARAGLPAEYAEGAEPGLPALKFEWRVVDEEFGAEQYLPVETPA